MDLAEYQVAAARTMRPDEIPTKDGEQKFGRDSALHFAIGLMGEVGEIAEKYVLDPDDQTIPKEIGDACWYIAMGATLFEMNLHTIARSSSAVSRPVDPTNPDQVLISLVGACAKIGEHVKKAAFFGHDLDFSQIETQLAVAWWHIQHLALIFGVPLDLILTMNIAKLRQRYPEGFSQERSR
jgi:NTP pyrophosphatase (non-canonical NTP hydrolase)